MNKLNSERVSWRVAQGEITACGEKFTRVMPMNTGERGEAVEGPHDPCDETALIRCREQNSFHSCFAQWARDQRHQEPSSLRMDFAPIERSTRYRNPERTPPVQ